MMTRRLALAMVLSVAVSGHSFATKPKDMDELTGVWECTSAINDGKNVDDETVAKLRLTLTKDGGFKTTLGERVLFDSTCTVDKTKSPRHIDMIGTEGENKGKAALGIYKIDDDKLTICYTMPGKNRPTEFKSEPGSTATLVVWRRIRKKV